MPGNVSVKEEVVTLEGWPTEVVRVDHSSSSSTKLPHTIVVFVPGNPGCIGWYTKNLVDLVERLGSGFAARGVSYVGHSANESLTQVERSSGGTRDVWIPWTIDGQIQHKCAFLDYILLDYKKEKTDETSNFVSPRFLFLSHSIGSHMVERLCVLRPDILDWTIGILHLMPFTRMNAASRWDQSKLDWGAAHPYTLTQATKCGMQVLQCLPISIVDRLLKGVMDDDKDRDLAVRLLRQPSYARNFFELGTEEIRDVPELVDVSALKWISSHCPMAMLYVGNDQWAPSFHMKELQEMQQKGVIPSNIRFTYMDELRHDYVSYMHMVPTVVDWCFESIQAMLAMNSSANLSMRSML